MSTKTAMMTTNNVLLNNFLDAPVNSTMQDQEDEEDRDNLLLIDRFRSVEDEDDYWDDDEDDDDDCEGDNDLNSFTLNSVTNENPFMIKYKKKPKTTTAAAASAANSSRNFLNDLIQKYSISEDSDDDKKSATTTSNNTQQREMTTVSKFLPPSTMQSLKLKRKTMKNNNNRYDSSTVTLSSSSSSSSSLSSSSSNLNDLPPLISESNRQFFKKHLINDKNNVPAKSSDEGGEDDDNGLNRAELKKIKEELASIHCKLLNEYRAIQTREAQLKEKAKRLKLKEQILIESNELDAKLRFEEIRVKYEDEIGLLGEQLKEKTRENRRLAQAFSTIKQSNDSLRKQLSEKEQKLEKLQKQFTSVNNRLLNLQKLGGAGAAAGGAPVVLDNELTTIATTTTTLTTTALIVQKQQQQQQQQNNAAAGGGGGGITTTGIAIQQRRSSRQSSKRHGCSSICSCSINNNSGQLLISNSNLVETFALLLEWLTQDQLRSSIDFSLPMCGNSKILNKCVHLLPLLAEMLIYLNNSSTTTVHQAFRRYHLAFLEFIYWSIVHCDSSFQNQPKIHLAATFRRIGEELYKSLSRSAVDAPGADSESTSSKATTIDLFLRSDNSQIRILSCLIIFRTLSQADHISRMFDLLRDELKNELTRKYFLDYHGTWTILKWFKLSNKKFLSSSIDIYLIMSIESGDSDRLLESCSNECWFSHLAFLFKQQPNSHSSLDMKIIEKLSVLLQKLSKIKINRKYFEMFGIAKFCHDSLTSISNQQHEYAFLFKNLKSILFNLKE